MFFGKLFKLYNARANTVYLLLSNLGFNKIKSDITINVFQILFGNWCVNDVILCCHMPNSFANSESTSSTVSVSPFFIDSMPFISSASI